jgi:hypothetical protein
LKLHFVTFCLERKQLCLLFMGGTKYNSCSLLTILTAYVALYSIPFVRKYTPGFGDLCRSLLSHEKDNVSKFLMQRLSLQVLSHE